MKKLDRALREFLRRTGLEWIEDYARMKEVVESVLSAYGDFEFVRFVQGVAYVKVRSPNPYAMNEIHYALPSILKAINRMLGKELVLDIKFVV